MNNRKKLLSAVLILLLMLAAAGCGGGENTSGENTSGENTSGESGGGSEGYDEPVNEETSDIREESYPAEDGEAEFKIGFSVSKSLGMSPMLEKMPYADLESLGEELEQRMNEGIAASLGGSYDVFSSYEPEEGEDMDDMILAAAMEDGDMESRSLEGGVYHMQSTDSFYQYLRYYTENFTEINSENLDSICESVKEAMGVSLSKTRLKKAVEIAFGNAKELQDEYTLVEVKDLKNEEGTEKVTVAVLGSTSEENETVYYVCVERERCYK